MSPHNIALTIIASLVAGMLQAQDTYYYYCGTRQDLTAMENMLVVITGKTDSPPAVGDSRLAFTVGDSLCSIRVYETCDSLSAVMRRVREHNPSGMALPCYKNETGMELVPTGYIYVRLKTSSDEGVLRSIASENSCRVVGRDRFMPEWFTLHLAEDSGLNPVDVANTMYETGLFSSSEPAFYFSGSEISYDPNVGQQWGLYNSDYEGIDISISEAWDYSTGRGIKIAVIDQGVDLLHRDLADNIYSMSYDAYTGSSPSRIYDSGHGTHCAGIASAVRNNNVLIAGVAPESAIMSVSVKFDDSRTASQLASGINWAWKNGADVISAEPLALTLSMTGDNRPRDWGVYEF